MGPTALVVLSCRRNIMLLKKNLIMLFSSGWLPFLRLFYLLKTIFISVACWQESWGLFGLKPVCVSTLRHVVLCFNSCAVKI